MGGAEDNSDAEHREPAAAEMQRMVVGWWAQASVLSHPAGGRVLRDALQVEVNDGDGGGRAVVDGAEYERVVDGDMRDGSEGGGGKGGLGWRRLSYARRRWITA